MESIPSRVPHVREANVGISVVDPTSRVRGAFSGPNLGIRNYPEGVILSGAQTGVPDKPFLGLLGLSGVEGSMHSAGCPTCVLFTGGLSLTNHELPITCPPYSRASVVKSL